MDAFANQPPSIFHSKAVHVMKESDIYENDPTVPRVSGCRACAEGYYSYRATDECRSCRDIIVNPNDDNVINGDSTPPITDSKYCPGGLIPPAAGGVASGRRLAAASGLSWNMSFVRPFEGFWIHVRPDGRVALLPCESGNTCLKLEPEALGTVRPRPGRLSTLGILHSASLLFGAFVWVLRSFTTPFWLFSAWADGGARWRGLRFELYGVHVRQLRGRLCQARWEMCGVPGVQVHQPRRVTRCILHLHAIFVMIGLTND